MIEDLFEWLCGPEGQLYEEVQFAVMDEIENAQLDLQDRVIVWEDGQRLSIEQTVKRIHLKTRLPMDKIESRVIGMLQMHFVPEDQSYENMELFEAMIEDWLRDYQISQGRGPFVP